MSRDIERLHSGATPEGYGGYVPAWAPDQALGQRDSWDTASEEP